MIRKLKDDNGKILIPGFYDDVKAPSDDELKAWKNLPFDEEHYRKNGSRLDGADGRAGIFGAGSHVGASDAGSARHAGRLRRRGREDGDTGEGVGEDFDADGAGHEPGRDLSSSTRIT